MLKVHNPLDVNDVIPFQIADEKRYVIHSYDGYDSLIFEFNSNDAICKYIAEEVKVEDETNRFVVKHIDEHSNFVTVTCDLDLDDWKQEIYYEFRTTNKTLLDVMQMITPQGWRIVGAEMFTKRTTVEGNEGSPLMTATPLEVLVAASEAYSCVFNFDVINRIVSAIDPTSYKASGEFFTDEINLKSLGFVGMSDGFATRLYAYGKKDENGVPMTFADINDGKPYVEDYSYSTKIVCIGWSDERYTNPASLLADAKARLKQVSHPSRSYECDARNLKNDVWLYKVVTLIDRKRGTRIDHQVVEYREYPNHSLDVITLSKSAPNIKSYVAQVQGNLNDSLSQESSSMHELVKDSIEHATQQITGNRGGHFAWIFDADGKPVELLNLCDSDDLNTAKSVWRWNASGLGHSKTGYNGEMTFALLPDGSINASAITTGILNADLLRTGTIRSVDGTIEIDLIRGSFVVHIPNEQGLDRQFRFSSNGLRAGGENSDTKVIQESLFIMPAVFGHNTLSMNYIGSSNGADLVVSTISTANTDGTITPPGKVIIGENPQFYAPDVIIKGKTISWKSNGDGTFTMIGIDQL